MRSTPRFVLVCLLTLITLSAFSACAGIQPPEQPTPTPGPPVSPSPTSTPAPVVYTVRSGDTLYGIANRYGVSIDDIIEINELTEPEKLQPGDRLLISSLETVSGRVLPTATPTPEPCLQGCDVPPDGCEIKGLIAQLDGTRLYALPEDEIYNRRQADIWFCRARDAEAAGWTRWTVFGPAGSP